MSQGESCLVSVEEGPQGTEDEAESGVAPGGRNPLTEKRQSLRI